jgi:branched-chain amino acid transport system substrate-binding protein
MQHIPNIGQAGGSRVLQGEGQVMNANRRSFVQGISAVAGATALAAVGPGNKAFAAGTGGPPIRIGAPLSATGPFAGDGEVSKISHEMAIEEINAAGGLLGRKLELVTYDIADLSPDKIKAGFTYLTTEGKADVLITQTLFTPGPEMEVCAATGVPLLHAAAVHDFSDLVKTKPDKYWMTFMMCPWEYVLGDGLLPAMETFQHTSGWKPRDKSIAMITTNSSYSNAIEKGVLASLKKYGWKVTMHESISPPLTEWGGILAKIRDVNPDLIFTTDYMVGDLAALQNQFMQNPTNSVMYGQWAPSLTEYMTLTKGNSTGVIYQALINVLNDGIAKSFLDRFRARTKVDPGGSTAGVMYDAVYLFANAVLWAGDPQDRKKVARFMRENIHRGVCGSYTFRAGYQDVPAYPDMVPDSSLGLPHVWEQIWEGKRNMISPAPYATTSFRVPPWFS